MSGGGRPLVLVHGAGSAAFGFDALVPHLAGQFEVLVMNRRGRRDSGDGDDYSLERELDDVVAVTAAAGPDALLVGHSFGALLAAGAAPRIDGLPALALYDPPWGGSLGDAALVARLEALLRDGRRAEMVRDFLHEIGGYSHEEIDAMQGTPAWQGRLEVAGTVPRELRAEQALRLDDLELGRLAAPVLMLVGEHSPQWARRGAEELARTFPDCRTRELAGQGHGAAAAAPELLARELSDFFAEAVPG